MKLTKLDLDHKVGNNTSSWVIYLAKTYEEARNMYQFAMTQSPFLKAAGWHYSASCKEVLQDCRVPSFFHDRGYYMAVIEHNNGSWDADQSYTLYIIE